MISHSLPLSLLLLFFTLIPFLPSLPFLLSSPPLSVLTHFISHPQVHAFYYGWYGNPTTDHKYLHWNHTLLPHWLPHITSRYPTGSYSPPLDPGTTYYPSRGMYSSSSPSLLLSHILDIYTSNIDIIAVNWHGEEEGRRDGQGVGTDKMVKKMMEISSEIMSKVRVPNTDDDDNVNESIGKIVFHMEPYVNRTIETIRADIIYIITQYSHYASFYKEPTTQLPLFYLYDSYHLSSTDWYRILSPQGDITLRNTPYDGIFIGLILSESDIYSHIIPSNFDGFYTYFSSVGFTPAAVPSLWPKLSGIAAENKILFSASVGAGYDDTRIRMWNGENKRERKGGKYYDNMWTSVINMKNQFIYPQIVSLTSYNEWGEGTQIEDAIPYITDKGVKMEDYEECVNGEVGEEGKEKRRQWIGEMKRRRERERERRYGEVEREIRKEWKRKEEEEKKRKQEDTNNQHGDDNDITESIVEELEEMSSECSSFYMLRTKYWSEIYKGKKNKEGINDIPSGSDTENVIDQSIKSEL